MNRIYITHCSASKDDSLRLSGRSVTPEGLYTSTRFQRFVRACQEAGAAWAVFSDFYGAWFPDEEHPWYEKDPDTVKESEFKALLLDFDGKLGAYDEICFYRHPKRFHRLYRRLVRESALRSRVFLISHLSEILPAPEVRGLGNSNLESLMRPGKVWLVPELRHHPENVPAEPGIYAWYFLEIPPGVPAQGCVAHDGMTLLYVGIAPKEPSATRRSRQTLRSRIRLHLTGNAEASTLRLSLGCLLSEKLEIELRRAGERGTLTFGETGEQRLSEWMDNNAAVNWLPCPEPWKLEEEALRLLSPPLNLRGNNEHPFHGSLTGLRKRCRDRAESLSLLSTPEVGEAADRSETRTPHESPNRRGKPDDDRSGQKSRHRQVQRSC